VSALVRLNAWKFELPAVISETLEVDNLFVIAQLFAVICVSGTN
jgi:hypothetical protein